MQTLSTSHGETLSSDTVALTIQPSTDPRPQESGDPSPITGTDKAEHHPSHGDIGYNIPDDSSTIDGGLPKGADCLNQPDCQHSPFIIDKALNTSWATGVSERGPDSNVELVEENCDRQDRVSNLGQPHQYGIALSDPYLKVVPPPPITDRPPD